MKKTLFSLVDTQKRVQPHAKLSVSCRLKSGRTWNSDPLETGTDGKAWLEVKPALIKQMQLETLAVEVTMDGRQVPVRMQRPRELNDGAYMVLLVVEARDKPEPRPEPGDPEPGGQPDTPTGPRPRRQSRPATMTVSGRIADDQGHPLPDLLVRVYDKGIGSEHLLNPKQKTTTDRDGAYKVEYTAEALRDPGAKAANLVVRAYASAQAKKPLASSSVVQKAPRQARIDLSVPRSARAAPSLFARIAERLSDLDMGEKIKDLTAEDAQLIAADLGLDPKTATGYVQSHVMAAVSTALIKAPVPAEPFFGLLLGGMQPTAAAFSLLRDAELARRLQQAVDNNWVGAMEVAVAVEAARPLRVSLLLEAATPWIAGLRKQGIGEPRLRLIAERYLASNLPIETVVRELGAEGRVPKDTVVRVEASAGLESFADGNRTLYLGLVNDYDITRLTDLLVLEGPDWNAIARKYFDPLPDWAPGKTDKARRESVAAALQCRLERRLPTPVFLQAGRDDRSIGKQQAWQYLVGQKNFELTRHTLEEHWEKSAKPGPEDTLKAVERVERLFHLGPDCGRFRVFKALWAGSIDSAAQVLRKGRGRFAEEMKKHGLAEADANAVFKRAENIAARHVLSKEWVPVGAGAAIDGANQGPGAQVAMPTLASLFGETGGVVCDPCVSVFGPAAYLIDLIRFLEKARVDGGGNGVDLLFQRRPDIRNLQVNCANAHTVLPYIDLVNEILEHVVATSAVPFKLPDDWVVTANLDLQTTWSAEQLTAHPEHIQPLAYERLRAVFSPWTLPYNLWSDEVRTYLEQISVDRFDLMLALRGGDSPFEVLELALERLGIDPAEAVVLAAPANTRAKRGLIWFDPDPATKYRPLGAFLDRTGLDFETLRDYFQSRFVNPDRRQIIPTGIQDPVAAELEFEAGDNDGLLDRLHRFARLHRRTGWTLNALDSALELAVDGGLDAAALGRLGALAHLGREFALGMEEVCAWFGPLPTGEVGDAASLYRRRFVDTLAGGAGSVDGVDLAGAVFGLDRVNGNAELKVVRSAHDKWLARLTFDADGNADVELHPLYAPVVSGGCRIPAADLATLLQSQDLGFGAATVALTLESISALYRAASISRALGIGVAEYLEWVELVGRPLGLDGGNRDASLAATVVLLPLVRELLQDGQSAALLLGTLHARPGAYRLGDEDALDTLARIQEELRKIRTESGSEPPTLEESVDTWLAVGTGLEEDDRGRALAMLRGDTAWDATLAGELDFLSVDSRERLSATITGESAEERLLRAHRDIPFDTTRIRALVDLALQYHDTDPANVHGFVASLIETVAGDHWQSYVPGLADAALIAAAPAERLDAALLKLRRSWVLKPALVAELAAAFGGGEDLVSHFLSLRPSPREQGLADRLLAPDFVDIDLAADSGLVGMLRRFAAQLTLVSTAGIRLATLEFVEDHGRPYGTLDWHSLGEGDFTGWLQLCRLDRLLGIGDDEHSMAALLGEMLHGGIDARQAGLQLAAMLSLSGADLDRLLSADGLKLALPDALGALQALQRIVDAAELLRKLKVDAHQAIALAKPVLGQAEAAYAKAAVRANYDDDGWLEVSEKLRGGLRERARDALIAFVRTRGGLQLSHEQAYAYYLVDVDMGSCFQTSRMKQAIASVQQFIQRILLGLEFEGDPRLGRRLRFLKDDAIEWQWRKNYRVWEANVKVFLYPENWLEPELRDNKTPLFESFEESLSQGEMTAELAEKAVLGYLEKLHAISRLDIINLCVDGETDTYHVIARTGDLPHQYFTRSWNGDTWSPWKPIETEIEGEHVLPVVHNRQLYVIWAEFEEVIDEQAVEDTGIDDQIAATQSRISEVGGASGEDGLIGDEIEARDTAQGIIDDIVAQLGEAAWLSNPVLAVYQSTVNTHNRTIETYRDELTGLETKLLELQNKRDLVEAAHTFERVSLSWIVEQPGGWSARKRSKQKLVGSKGTVSEKYHFMAAVSHQTRELEVWAITGDMDFMDWAEQPFVEGIFALSGCTGEMQVRTPYAGPVPHLMVYANSRIEKTRHVVTMNRGAFKYGDFAPLGYGAMLQAAPADELDVTRIHNLVDQPFPCFVDSRSHLFFVYKHYPDPEGSASYRFDLHYHPFTCAMLRQLRRFGIRGLYAPEEVDNVGSPDADILIHSTRTAGELDFVADYEPVPGIVDGAYPFEKIDFSLDSSYGQYNWEVFFHVPMMVATRLMQNRKYDQARRWLHFIFDPTEAEGEGLQRFWKIKPFYWAQIWGLADDAIGEQLDMLDASRLDSLVEEWEDNPFQPYAIARFRIVSFMRMTVMKYLDNLIAWGDSLFRMDTMESINEATGLYVTAANILGPRPLTIEADTGRGEVFTVGQYLDRWTIRQVPWNGRAQAGPKPKSDGAVGILGVLDQFCLPYNDRLDDYWDTVADRLFKVRHCQNIDGVYRQLPLFQPPIDPALLVKAAASGLDLSAVLADMAAPRPLYRFTVMVQRARELADTTRNLGAQLLGALEKKDAEAIARMRGEHETELLKLGLAVRKDAVREARLNVEVLEKGKETVEKRRDFYAGRDYMNVGESLDMSLRFTAWALRTASQVAEAAVLPLHAIPNATAGAAGTMGSPVTLVRVPKPADAAQTAANVLGIFADLTQTAAGMAQTVGAFDRRQEDWDHQVAMAEGELAQFEKQLDAAAIRLAMAEREQANVERQVELAEEATAFLRDKFTSRQLYSWMVTQLSTLYYQTYQLAYETAKQAEKCYRYELGNADSHFIQFGYWDSLKKGLLAGERLQLDLQRMENAFASENVREYELTRTISLAQVDPLSLMRLQQTGECYIQVSERLLDMDYPGHYFRRIKSVSLTLPAVAGPYSSVSSTLTLLSNRYRNRPLGGDDESLFTWDVGKIESIATSSGNQDSGLFQLDFNDPRYLPFERAGAISSWRLRLNDPSISAIDYAAIGDVLLTIRYTARDGGDAYRDEVIGRLKEEWTSYASTTDGLGMLMSVKRDSAVDWNRFRQQAVQGTSSAVFELDLSSARFPYVASKRGITIHAIRVFAVDNGIGVLDPGLLGSPRLIDSGGAELGAAANGFMVDPGLRLPATTVAVDTTPLEGRCALEIDGIDASATADLLKDIVLLVEYRVAAVG